MVRGREALHRRIQAIPKNIRHAARAKMEQEATRIVAHMRNLNSHPAVEINWTWGDPPGGALTLGRVGASADDLRITIYATARSSEFPGGFAALARWAEFGTGPRYQKTTGRYVGAITASPYFYPAWRANSKRAKSAIRRAITKAFKES